MTLTAGRKIGGSFPGEHSVTVNSKMDEAGAINELFGDNGRLWIIEAIQEAVDRGDIAGLRRLRRVADSFKELRQPT